MPLTNYLPTGSQLIAAGRHVVSYAMGAATFAAGVGFLTPDQAHQATSAVQQLADSIINGYGAIYTLTGIGMAVFAGRAVSPKSQIAAVNADPELDKVLVKPGATGPLAEAAADPKLDKVKKEGP